MIAHKASDVKKNVLSIMFQKFILDAIFEISCFSSVITNLILITFFFFICKILIPTKNYTEAIFIY